MRSIKNRIVWAFVGVAAACTSQPSRRSNFFQALELAGDVEASTEAFRSACASGSSAACHRLGRNVSPSTRLPILQGATTPTATEIIILFTPDQNWDVLLWDMTHFTLAQGNRTEFELPQGRAVHFRYEGLSPNTPYRLQVVAKGGTLIDGRDLQTLDTEKKRLRFAVASCMDEAHPDQEAVWRDLLSREPEVLFLIGDNVYVKTAGVSALPEVLFNRYWQTRQTLALFKTPRLVPVLAVWDDNDYGQPNGDRSYSFKDDSRRIFEAYFGRAQYTGVYDRGPGVSSRFNAFGQRFFFLDSRSFRSPRGEKNSQTHFGVDQEAWLFTEMYGQVPTWLISGDQFFGAYHSYDSYEGNQPQSFERFKQRLASQSSPVLFLSGDRHLAEIMSVPADTLGYQTYEITTSSIHASVYPDAWKKTPNPRQIEGVSGVNNYALIESDATEPGVLKVYARIYGSDGRRLMAREMTVRR